MGCAARAPAGQDLTADYREPPGIDAAEADADEAELRAVIVGAGLHGKRLDLALVDMAPEFSRNHLQHLIEQGHVQVDGVTAASASRRVQAGQRLAVELIATAETRAFRAEPMPLAIVHEDDALLVVDKPVGLVVHPAPGHWSGTLLNGLLAHHAAASGLPRAGIVHRLDKDTSGLMVVGKTLSAVTALSRAIAAREVHREYLAIAHGGIEAQAFTVDAPIGRDPRSRVRMAIVPYGRPARTEVAVVHRAARFSALRCTLHTGRTHQIRVHLASRGHPLVADALYGGAAALGLQRQALHAQRLELLHPVSGQRMGWSSAAPQDLAAALRRMDDPA
jgi:23S rRNA pseudouridine1911/1915/1917 synthase